VELPHRWHRSKTGSDFGWYRFTIPGEKLASTEDTLALDLGVIGYSSWWEVWRSRGIWGCAAHRRCRPPARGFSREYRAVTHDACQIQI